MRRHAILIPATLLALAACGGGGGGGNGGLPPADPADLGSRAVPGYDLQVRHLGPIDVGHPLTISATITPDGTVGTPALVELGVAAAEPTTWTASTQAADGSWTWTATLPADLTDQRVWLRVTDAEGNVSQSGGEDFALAQ